MKAIWQTAVLAESDQTIEVEGNHYFPPDSLKHDHFRPSDKRTTCHWKGIASYYHVRVGDHLNQDAAWYYSDPKQAAERIKSYVAFWRGVTVTD
jgi:uncharacterized protein (DUF427 family)